jgi:hypothetical protein
MRANRQRHTIMGNSGRLIRNVAYRPGKKTKVTVIFKDVTYESLSDRKFIEVARKALPNLNMLHEEYLAAEGLTREAKASAVGELQ